MGDIYYTPLIQEMTWSYSRIRLFESCPYSWYLKYICKLTPRSDQFFSSYGSFMHKLLEQLYSGTITKQNAILRYLTDFQKNVGAGAPSHAIYANYFADGLSYFRSAPQLPFAMLATEQQVQFDIDGIPMKGFVDYVGQNSDGLAVVDHKSRTLKERSNRKKPTKSDMELDVYFRQLYLYALAIKKRYGVYPSVLCLNCFREKLVIKERFDEKKMEEAKQWVKDMVNKITYTTDFPPDWEYFKCNYLCDMCDHCEYHQMNSK